MLQEIVIIGLSAFYLTNLIRRFPKIESLAMAGKRPWSCNACMSFWTMLPAAFYLSQAIGLAWPTFLAGSGLCFFLLQFLEPPPPELPPPPPNAQ